LQVIADSAETEAEVLVYDANPYRMQEIVAAEGLFTLLVKRYAQAQPLTDRPSVNIIGPASLGFHVRPDMICLRRIMQTLGVDINVVAPLGATLVRWLNRLVALLNEVGARTGGPAVEMPHLTKFSLDGISAPSGVPWFARTADMESFSSKRAFVFGDATHTVGMVKFLRDELAMPIAGAGTYLAHEADWVREQLDGYLPDELLVTEEFQEVANRIEGLLPELVCGTQMERHSCRKLDVPCMVTAPPTHIENHLLGYTPMLGFDGADHIADKVYTTATLGLEKHLIDLFGDAGLEYENGNGTATNGAAPLATNESDDKTDVDISSDAAIPWTEDAAAMLNKVPFFVRRRVRKNTEQFAADNGHDTITVDVLQAAKEAIGG